MLFPPPITATFPPVTGLYQFYYGPAQWRVAFVARGYGPPFDGHTFLLSFVLGSAPGGLYVGTPSPGYTVTLEYGLVGNPVLTVAGPGGSYTYTSKLAWQSGDNNKVYSSDHPLTVPSNFLLVPTLPFAAFVPDLLSGLDAYWSFGPLGPLVLLDQSGNGYTLSNSGGVVAATGLIGNCAVFAGEQVLIIIGSSLKPGATDVTLSYWFNIPVNDRIYGHFCTLDGGANSLLGTCSFTAGQVGVSAWNGSAFQELFSGLGLFVSGQWVHVVVTYAVASQLLSLFVNGLEVGSVVLTGPLGSAVIYDAFGTYLGPFAALPGMEPLHGSMDEIGIWGRVLNPLEILALYNGGVGITYPF